MLCCAAAQGQQRSTLWASLGSAVPAAHCKSMFFSHCAEPYRSWASLRIHPRRLRTRADNTQFVQDSKHIRYDIRCDIPLNHHTQGALPCSQHSAELEGPLLASIALRYDTVLTWGSRICSFYTTFRKAVVHHKFPCDTSGTTQPYVYEHTQSSACNNNQHSARCQHPSTARLCACHHTSAWSAVRQMCDIHTQLSWTPHSLQEPGDRVKYNFSRWNITNPPVITHNQGLQ
jgi:hypothetical protein